MSRHARSTPGRGSAWAAALAIGAMSPIAAGAQQHGGPSMIEGQSAAHDNFIFTLVKIDQLEYRLADGENSFAWEGEGWIGTDEHKLWIKSEGEKVIDSDLEDTEVQALYSRPISDFFDVQAGIRYDVAPRPRRGYGVFGIQGLGVYFFELEAAGFVSNEGELSARLRGEYDLLVTQRLVLTPELEVNMAASQVRDRGIGRGVNDIEAGLRLRYEFTRGIGAYIGVNYERLIGDTRDFAQDEDEDTGALSFVTGVRLLF